MPARTKHVPSTFLRWAGSKRKLLGELELYWDIRFERYIEPFAGSACLFYRLAPSISILSDKNAELIQALQTIAKHPDEVYDNFERIPRSKEDYLRLRATRPDTLNQLSQAVRFLYLNRNCFNGIYRTNRSGQFNVPYGGLQSGKIMSRKGFVSSAKLLSTAKLCACDFGTTLRNTRKGDFVYLDPPYAVSSRRVFCEYSGKPFTVQDLTRLSSHLTKMDRRGVKFVVSYADSRESREIAKYWNSRIVYVRRNVAGFTGARKKARELLFSNIC